MHHAHIDRFSFQDSWFHRLDSRTKVMATGLFTLAIVALPRTAPALPLVALIGPFTILVLAGIPLRFVAKHLLWLCPFLLTLALSSVWFDRDPVHVSLGSWQGQTTTGWLRAITMMGKFVVTMTALIALVSTTRFHDLLVGLQRLRVPQLLVIQLGFLYRYLFVLIDSAHHLLRARATRQQRSLGWRRELSIGAAMIGSLLTRSLTQAEHINRAMQARGFTGQWTVSRTPRLGTQDFLFIGLCLVYLIVLLWGLAPYLILEGG